MVSEEPNTGLHKYSEGEAWFDGTDNDPPGHNDIVTWLAESHILFRIDTESNRTNYNAYDGAGYLPSDSDQLYEGDGTSWNPTINFGASPGLDVVATGSKTLSGGEGTADTGVSTDSEKYTVFFNPGNADIAMSFDGSGSDYKIHFEEIDTSVGTPAVTWSLIRL